MIDSIETQLARDEGRRLQAYRDSRGFWTIGIGHYLGETIPPGFADGISDTQCDALFSADLAHVQQLLATYTPWWTEIDPVRAAVLENMGFNLGVPGLALFSEFLGFMQAQNWVAAANDLRTTRVFQQLPLRYGRLVEQITTGVWQ